MLHPVHILGPRVVEAEPTAVKTRWSESAVVWPSIRIKPRSMAEHHSSTVVGIAAYAIRGNHCSAVMDDCSSTTADAASTAMVDEASSKGRPETGETRHRGVIRCCDRVMKESEVDFEGRAT